MEEATVYLSMDIINKLRTIFESLKEKPDEQDTVDFNTLIGTIAEDKFF